MDHWQSYKSPNLLRLFGEKSHYWAENLLVSWRAEMAKDSLHDLVGSSEGNGSQSVNLCTAACRCKRSAETARDESILNGHYYAFEEWCGWGAPLSSLIHEGFRFHPTFVQFSYILEVYGKHAWKSSPVLCCVVLQLLPLSEMQPMGEVVLLCVNSLCLTVLYCSLRMQCTCPCVLLMLFALIIFVQYT